MTDLNPMRLAKRCSEFAPRVGSFGEVDPEDAELSKPYKDQSKMYKAFMKRFKTAPELEILFDDNFAVRGPLA